MAGDQDFEDWYSDIETKLPGMVITTKKQYYLYFTLKKPAENSNPVLENRFLCPYNHTY